MTIPRRRNALLRPMQLIALAFALILGGFMIAARVSAQPQPPVGSSPRGLLPPRDPAATPAGSAAAGSAKADDKKADDKKGDDKKGDDKGKDDKKDDDDADHVPALDTAELGPNGGVPTHKIGRFRSPFANPDFGAPARVRVGVLLSHIRNYNIKEGTFDADLFVSFTSDKPMPKMDPDFTNGNAATKEVLANRPTFKLFHLQGTLSSPPDIHKYPFDTQALTIEIEDDRNGSDQIILEADKEHTNLDVGFQVSGWDVAYLEARVLQHYFPDRFDHDDLYHSRYKLTLGMSRYGTSAAFTVFVPAFVIVLIAVSGMWLPKDELEVRANAGAPMLAAAVLFHFTLTQNLPPTPYLTRADKLMMAVYASLFLNIVATWLWFVFDDRHEQRIFHLGKWLVPPLTLLLMLAGSFG